MLFRSVAIRKLRLHVSPILVANSFLWIYNLWQWKTVPFLAFPNSTVTPGVLWEVMEAILFPPAIFFRFHSAFICFMLLHLKFGNMVARVSSRWRRNAPVQNGTGIENGVVHGTVAVEMHI